jgi:hypothetical protein
MIPLAVVVLADYAGTVELSNRTEVRGRHVTQSLPAASTAGQPPDPSMDLADSVLARISLKNHEWDHSLGYSAIGSFPDTELGVHPQLFQNGDIGTTWHTRQVQLTVAEYAGYGEQNSAYLLTVPTPAQAVPIVPPAGVPGAAPPLAQPTTIRLGNSRSVLGSRLVFSRRWFATTLVEYQMQGGVDAESRATLPFLYGPRGEASATYALSRVDDLETRASWQHSQTSEVPCNVALEGYVPGSTCAPTSDIVRGTETWQHRLSRSSSASLGGGGAYLKVHVNPDTPTFVRIYPAVVASFRHEHVVEDVRTTFRIDAQIAPSLDVRSGIADERAIGATSLALPFRDYALTGSLTVSRTISSQLIQPLTMLQGGLEVDYHLDRHVSVGTGARFAWQEQGSLGSFATFAAYAALTLRAPQVHF